MGRPKKDEKAGKSEAPSRKIITGATIKAGVMAAAASGVAVIGAAGDRDDADEMVGTLKEADVLLAPDHDEEDRVSDIANIPGVQEIKIEDETRKIIEKQQLEEEEKDSLILHEEGVIEHVEKEDVIKEEEEDEKSAEGKDKEKSFKDEKEEVEDEKEKEQEKEKKKKVGKDDMEKDDKCKVEVKSKLTEDIEEEIDDEDKDKVSIEEEQDGDEKEVKAEKVIEKVDISKDDKHEVDDQDEKMETEDAYATLPSSAKLTDYKEKYEDRPLRGIFTGFNVPSEQGKPISTKPKDEFPVPSSLPEAIFKPTAPPSHPREIIKTPDEVDDLPIHEEVESTEHEVYDQATKSQKLDVTSPSIEVKGKLQMKEEILPEKHEREDVKES